VDDRPIRRCHIPCCATRGLLKWWTSATSRRIHRSTATRTHWLWSTLSVDTTATARYVAALAGGFTLLGGIITLAGGYLSDRRKAEREDTQRWDRDIREASARVLVECVKVQEYYLPDGPRPARISPTGDELELTVASVYQTYYELTLIAPKPTRNCAYDLMVATNTIANLGLMGVTPGQDKRSAASENFPPAGVHEKRKDGHRSPQPPEFRNSLTNSGCPDCQASWRAY